MPCWATSWLVSLLSKKSEFAIKMQVWFELCAPLCVLLAPLHAPRTAHAPLAACRHGALLLVCKRWQRVDSAQPEPWQDVRRIIPYGMGAEEAHRSWARLLQRVQCTVQHIRSLEVAVHHAELRTPAKHQLPELLRCLRANQLCSLLLAHFPLSEAATRELCRLAPQLECLSLWLGNTDVQPPSTSVLLGQLTALTSLELRAYSFAPSLTQAVSCLPLLCSLRLASSEALPDPAPLTALTALISLVLEEDQSAGLRLLPAASFPRLCAYTISAPFLQASMGRGRGWTTIRPSSRLPATTIECRQP